MKVAELDWATGWVLSHGGAAEALAPPELVDRVRAEAEALLSRYRVTASEHADRGARTDR